MIEHDVAWGCRVGGLREIAAPFVVAAPSGARVRTRLRVSAADAAVLRAVGRHLASLASADLAARCREGPLDARGRARSRRDRKRELTAGSSSRWAGAVTRASEDQWQLGWRNLGAEAATLRARVKTMESRLAVPAGTRTGRVRGYASQAERFAKQRRLQALQARLAAAGQRAAAGRVSVVRGGRRLLRARANLIATGLTQAQWRERWDAGRLFLTADGEKDKAWGNETIRFNPDEGWLELKLPAPLAHLANAPHGRYRLSCPVSFAYRGDEVAAQAATGAVRYDISLDPDTGRWYLDASWKTSPGPAPDLAELRAHPVVAGRRERRAPRRLGAHPGREPSRAPGHDPSRPGRAARLHAGRPGPGRRHRPDRRRPAARGKCGRDREPRLRPGPGRGPGTRREPPSARPPREAVPGPGVRHSHRQVPGPAYPDDPQRQARGDRRGPRLYVLTELTAVG